MKDAQPTYAASAPKTNGRAPGALERVSIEPTDNGGFIVTCSHAPGAGKKEPFRYEEPKKYALGSVKELKTYLGTLFDTKA